jgi:hypothetical protein
MIGPGRRGIKSEAAIPDATAKHRRIAGPHASRGLRSRPREALEGEKGATGRRGDAGGAVRSRPRRVLLLVLVIGIDLDGDGEGERENELEEERADEDEDEHEAEGEDGGGPRWTVSRRVCYDPGVDGRGSESPEEDGMIRILDAESGKELGTITEAQFQVLVDLLEEEAEGDEDYYISADTLDFFEEEGAEPALIEFLRKALGEREEMEIRWKKE